LPVKVREVAMDDRMAYEWPANIRELENCIEGTVALGRQNVIDVHDLPQAIRRLSEAQDASVAVELMNSTDLEELERETIMRVFEQTKGDKALTGRMLGISRATLYRKLKRYNIGSASAMATTPS